MTDRVSMKNRDRYKITERILILFFYEFWLSRPDYELIIFILKKYYKRAFFCNYDLNFNMKLSIMKEVCIKYTSKKIALLYIFFKKLQESSLYPNIKFIIEKKPI